MNGLGTEGKWYEFSFDYKNIDRHLVMAGIQTASSGAGALVSDPATSKALSTFVQGSLMTLYDYTRGNSLQDSYLNNMNWNGMMVNMSDLGNQMGSMMKKGLDGQKAPASDPEADPFRRADTMLGGLFVSMGRGLGQTGKSITDLIAGSALGSAVGDLYSGSMLDTAVGGLSDGFNYARNTINSGINKVKDWGNTAWKGVKNFAVDTYERAGNWVNNRGFNTDNEIKELFEQSQKEILTVAISDKALASAVQKRDNARDKLKELGIYDEMKQQRDKEIAFEKEVAEALKNFEADASTVKNGIDIDYDKDTGNIKTIIDNSIDGRQKNTYTFNNDSLNLMTGYHQENFNIYCPPPV